MREHGAVCDGRYSAAEDKRETIGAGKRKTSFVSYHERLAVENLAGIVGGQRLDAEIDVFFR